MKDIKHLWCSKISKWYFDFSSPWEHNWVELSVIRSTRDWVLCNKKVVMNTDFCASSVRKPKILSLLYFIFVYILLNALHIEYSLVKLRAWWSQPRGRAEKEPRISIPVPAVPVSELLAGKSQRNCNSLNWFKGVTFTFWIKIYRKNIFPKINSKIYKFSVFFLPEVPIPALPEPESKFLVPSLLAP